MIDVSLVIPLLNEAESLPELCSWIVRVCEQEKLSYEVLLLDDGSTDNSWDVIEELAKSNTCIRGIRMRRNYGKSGALNIGFAAAKGEVVILPEFADSLAFQKWLPSVKGKYVMISVPQPTGRPDYNWEEHGMPASIEKMKAARTKLTESWTKRLQATGKNRNQLPLALENAGAAGILTSNWSNAFGANKIFSASTKKVPTVDISLEDYGLLYRLAESGKKPMLHLNAQSKETGIQPTYNTVAEIKGSTKPDEYVMLSAHFDSWDGGTGATDNGTGTILMMEVMLTTMLAGPFMAFFANLLDLETSLHVLDRVILL
jgi:hypothetical protein